MLTNEIIKKYNQTRNKNAQTFICHAPYVNLNFEQNGNVTACCYNRTFVLGKYPENTIQEIWNGEQIKELRNYIKEGDLSGGCSACGEVIMSGNFSGSKARYFDEYAGNKNSNKWFKSIFKSTKNEILPKVLEFEISNSCNLECTMCSGYFSSAIRKNREKLPAFKNHYDLDFVEQISHFLPTLIDAKFLGGEPFLIDLYYKIWDKIIMINPKIRVHITTNGTVLNKKVKNYLEQLNAGIVISLESLNRERYEQIRVNASFDILMESIHYFIDYTKKKGTYLSFAVCPIQKNWMDIPDIIKFCNEHEIDIHFNTVWSPETESLMYLDAIKLSEIIDFYNEQSLHNKTRVAHRNEMKFKQLIDQLSSWREERGDMNGNFKIDTSLFLKINTRQITNDSKEFQLVFLSILNQYDDAVLNELKFILNTHLKPLFDIDTTNLDTIINEIGIEMYIQLYFESLKILAKEKFETYDEYISKVDAILAFMIALHIDNLKPLLVELNRSGFIFLFEYLYQHTEEELIQMMKSRFVQNIHL